MKMCYFLPQMETRCVLVKVDLLPFNRQPHPQRISKLLVLILVVPCQQGWFGNTKALRI